MCDLCDKIAGYQRHKDQINDQQTKAAADSLSAELRAKRTTLHPEKADT